MRKHIAVGVRVSARRGAFLPSEAGQRRQRRGLWYGVVNQSVPDGIWGLNWDNGQSTVEKYNQLQVEKENSGRIPLLPLSPIGDVPHQPSRNVNEDLIERLDAGLGAEVTQNGANMDPRSMPSQGASNDLVGNINGPLKPILRMEVCLH